MHRKFTWVLSLLGRNFQWRHKTGAVNSRPFLLQVVLIAEPFWTYLATWNNYNVYELCVLYVWTMCSVCMNYVYCMYALMYVWTIVLWTMCIVCMNYVYCMYELLYVWTICIVYMNYVYCMYELCVLYVWIMCIVCMNFMYCMYINGDRVKVNLCWTGTMVYVVM